MTTAAQRDEKKKKERKEEKKEGITHHNLLRIKLYLYLAKYMYLYYSFNFIGLADYIDLTDDTCSREISSEIFWIADLQLCMEDKNAYKEEIG